MFHLLKKIIRGSKASTEDYIKHLKKIGMSIGIDVSIYSPINTIIDEQYPTLIHIGNHVRITEGVKILTHDYSWSVLKNCDEKPFFGSIMGCAKPISIGDNVFIGMNSIILGGVSIGDNVIVGAGSVVTKSFGSNVVIAGNPARMICSLNDYYQKRRQLQLKEASDLAVSFYNKFHSRPPKSLFKEFFMLFSDGAIDHCYDSQLSLGKGKQSSLDYMRNNKPLFKTFDDFLDYCLKAKEKSNNNEF